MSDTIKLHSPVRNMTVVLKGTVSELHPQYGLVQKEKGEVIRFSEGVAEVTPEQFAMLERHPAYTGSHMEPKQVWSATELEEPRFGGPEVVAGAVSTTPVKRVPQAPPVENWDQMGAKQIQAALKLGEVKDLRGALEWELAHKKRATVLGFIGAAMGSLEDEPADEALPDSFAAPIPMEAA